MKWIPTYMLASSIEPFSKRQLQTAAMWWGSFLSPHTGNGPLSVAETIHEQLYDEARGAGSFRVSDGDHKTSVMIRAENRNDTKVIEVRGMYPGSDGERQTQQKIMVLHENGSIEVYDHNYNHKTKDFDDPNRVMILCADLSRVPQKTPS